MATFTVTADTFQKEVLESKEPVLLDFWASWCGPCRMMSPVVDALSEEYAGKMKFGKVNVDEQPSLAAQFGVMSIPTLILFKDGKPVKTSVGYRSKEALEPMLK